MVKKILLFLGLAIIALAPADHVLAASKDYMLIDGVVTNIERSPHFPKTHCDIYYEVTIDGETFNDKNGTGMSDFCHLETGDTIKIKYLASDPRQNDVASKWDVDEWNERESEENPSIFLVIFGVIAAIPFFVGPLLPIIIVIAIISKSRKLRNGDVDGDGLGDDKKPATPEQRKLIQEGFRDLGIHHEPKKKMTQAQARETLREIDKKLKNR